MEKTVKDEENRFPTKTMDTTFTNKEISREKRPGSKHKEPNPKPGVDNPDQIPEEIPEPKDERSTTDEKGNQN